METEYFKREGLMVILSSPSGAGKTTVSNKLLEIDGNLEMSISVTTRRMRQGEVDEKDYFFIDKRKYNEMKDGKNLLESAEVFGNFYGTPKDKVFSELDLGKDILFDVDWQGARQLVDRVSDRTISIFILPPSLEELERRLKLRASDSDEIVNFRMERAKSEISHYDEYDYVIVNNDVEESVSQIHSILKVERLKRKRLTNLSKFVEGKLS